MADPSSGERRFYQGSGRAFYNLGMRLLALLTGSIVVLSASLTTERAAEPFVPFAVSYDVDASRDHVRITRDLETIRSLGFNSVRVVWSWRFAEVVRGIYTFAALDQLLTRARDADLKVIVEIDTLSAPAWIRREYPDARVVVSNADADPSIPSGYCLDHPGVRGDVATFIMAVSARAGGHASVHAVDVGPNPAAGFCSCPHSQRRFAEWLTAGGARAAPSPVPLIDKATFAVLTRRDELKMKVDASALRGGRLLTAYTRSPSVLRPPRAGEDEWVQSRLVDHFGGALTPTTADLHPRSAVQMAMALDGIRSATRDRGWWASALNALDATAADLRLWNWAAISRGARAIVYDDSLLGKDGIPTGAARTTGQVAGIVSRNPALFAPLRPRPSAVAILYNPLPVLSTGSASPLPVSSMTGFYRAMLERNIQTDFISLDETVAGVASSYRAVFLGYPVVLTQPVADALKAYVAAGGTLISEARPAASNERGQTAATIPGAGLDEVFGAREIAHHASNTVTMNAERNLDGALASVAGRAVLGLQFADHLEPTRPSTRVLARYQGAKDAPGHPAIVMSEHGSGRAILMGSLTAAAFDANPPGARASGDLLAALVALAGVTPDVRIEGANGLVETRYLESSDVIMLIGLNHTSAAQTVTFRFAPDTQEAIWQNMVSGTAVNFVATPEGPRYTHTIGPKDALVLMIRKHMR
jgi:hypothetical protein